MVTEHKTDNKSKSSTRIILSIFSIIVIILAGVLVVTLGNTSGIWGTILSIALPALGLLVSLAAFFWQSSFRSLKEVGEQPREISSTPPIYITPSVNPQSPSVLEIQAVPISDISSAYAITPTPTATGPLARNLSASVDPRKDFFVSYSKDDRQWAEWIAWELEDAKYTTVLPAWDYLPGTDINIMIDETLKEAKRTLLVLSPAYLDELKKRREVVKILKRSFESTEDRVIPVCVKECKDQLFKMFGPITYVDLVGLSQSEAREALLISLSRKRAKPQTPPAFPGSTK